MMRNVMAAMVVCAAGIAAAGGEEPKGLVVHEWGTFTSFSAADGAPRQFWSTIGEDLPQFVWSRAKQGGYIEDGQDPFVGGKLAMQTTHRMETPVIYFYSPQQMRVNVDVLFPKGLITEFYPPLSVMTPAASDIWNNPVGNSGATWSNLLVSPGPNAEQTARVPVITGSKTHYGAARDTDSALISFDRNGQTFTEKFLFYRGVANLDVPITLRAAGGDRFVMTTPKGESIPAAFVVQRIADGLRYSLRFSKYEDIGGVRELTLASETATEEDLAGALRGELVEAGLYEKEAAAMVATWRSTWFGEAGTRVLYIMPSTMVDQVLPLSVTPRPAETARVFVGRLEVVTPEVQKMIESGLAAFAEAPLAPFASAPAPDQPAFWDRAAGYLGRFAPVGVRLIGETTQDQSAAKGWNAIKEGC